MKIYKRKKEIFTEIDDPHMPEDIKRLLHKLHNHGYKLVIASGNNRTVIDNFLSKQNSQNIFDCTITGDELEKGKPDPEVFLKALKKMDLPKNEVLIVENAPLGVEAAKASGIFTVAITSTVSKDILSKADKVIENLHELEQILEIN